MIMESNVEKQASKNENGLLDSPEAPLEQAYLHTNLVANAGEGRESYWAAKIQHLTSNAQAQILTIQLESGDPRAQKVDSSGHARWIDNDSLDLSSYQNSSRGTADATSFGAPYPERDDILRMGVHVQHDVHVEHSPL